MLPAIILSKRSRLTPGLSKAFTIAKYSELFLIEGGKNLTMLTGHLPTNKAVSDEQHVEIHVCDEHKLAPSQTLSPSERKNARCSIQCSKQQFLFVNLKKAHLFHFRKKVVFVCS